MGNMSVPIVRYFKMGPITQEETFFIVLEKVHSIPGNLQGHGWVPCNPPRCIQRVELLNQHRMDMLRHKRICVAGPVDYGIGPGADIIHYGINPVGAIQTRAFGETDSVIP